MHLPQADLDQLNNLIRNTYQWTPGPDNTFITHGYSSSHEKVTHTVPYTHLDALHLKFLEAMLALVYWYTRQEKKDFIPNRAVNATLNFLQRGGIEMMSTDYKSVTLIHIDGMSTANWSEHILDVRGTAVHTQSGRGPYQDVVFATDTYNSYASVHKTDLEKRYPGWEQRWKIASELGVDMSDLVKHVFCTNPTSAPRPARALADVTFEYV